MLGKSEIISFVTRCINKITGGSYILNNISAFVMLVQLIDTAGNVNDAVIIIECWIYD